jgi:hypothetical protein
MARGSAGRSPASSYIHFKHANDWLICCRVQSINFSVMDAMYVPWTHSISFRLTHLWSPFSILHLCIVIYIFIILCWAVTVRRYPSKFKFFWAVTFVHLFQSICSISTCLRLTCFSCATTSTPPRASRHVFVCWTRGTGLSIRRVNCRLFAQSPWPSSISPTSW